MRSITSLLVRSTPPKSRREEIGFHSETRSTSEDPMKFKINKACDLSSISVLPPRRSNGMSTGAEGLGRSQSSQIRSLSQQSFSQGMSQLSQNSFEENLIGDQRHGSQDKDYKRGSSLGPFTSTRDEPQLQLAKSSNKVLRRWNTPYVSENKCQVGEELENKLRLMERSISKVGMILDSVQSDVMQVNRAVKEVALEAEGIRQKILLLEGSVQQMGKQEDDIKKILDESLKSISDQLMNYKPSILNGIALTLRSLPDQIETHIRKLENDLRMVFSKEKEVMVSSSRLSNKFVNFPSPLKKSFTDGRQYLKGQLRDRKIIHAPQMINEKKSSLSKPEDVKPKVTPAFRGHNLPPRKHEQNLRIIIDSDEESDGDFSCFILKEEPAKEIRIMDEVQEDTLRILRKARKRRRRCMNSVVEA